MKKIVMLLLTACLLLSLAACGKNTEDTNKNVDDSQTMEESQNTDESQGTEEFQEPVDEETIEGVINRLDD